MGHHVDVSIVISTYNRCELLPKALESLLAQAPGDVSYEVIIVDNNSTDETRQVVESLSSKHRNLRYIFEPKQGLSHGRNAGIANARASIIAFTDDDIQAGKDWIANIKGAFDRHPEADLIGGRVLPIWARQPPSWLTIDHWSPLAILDYGPVPFKVDSNNALCLVGANFAVRRRLIDRLGPFNAELQRVGDSVGSLEDFYQLECAWRAGLITLYEPSIVVTAQIPEDRTSKAYHRRWHTGHGKFYSLMRSPDMERSYLGRLFDVPGHLYKQFAKDLGSWLRKLIGADFDGAFLYEVRLRFFLGFFSQRRSDFRAAGQRHSLRDLARLLKAVARRSRKKEEAYRAEHPVTPESRF
jgi:glycosyltransferase involved in cell wall biosynthesis